MKTTLLATSHYLQDWKAGAKSCQMQQSKYILGIRGAAPTRDQVCAFPYGTPKGNHEDCFDFGVGWISLRGFNTCPIGLQKQMFYTHQSDTFFSAFGNQNSWTAALIRRDRACLQNGINQNVGWFLTAPVPKMPSFSAWIFSPGEFEDYAHLTKIFQ